MKRILVTGSSGFIGKHLCLALARQVVFDVIPFDRDQQTEDLPRLTDQADLVFHLAGVNRPTDPQEFQTGNEDLTRRLCSVLSRRESHPPLVFSSSIQAATESLYGVSKRRAEESVLAYGRATGAPVRVYRLANVFGKWSRPDYNTVVATFCHRLTRGLPVEVHDPRAEIRLLYIDDLIREFLKVALAPAVESASVPLSVTPEFSISVGELLERLTTFQLTRPSGILPNLNDPLTQRLFTTYTSFLPSADLARPAEVRTDNRGWLFELVKSPHMGQVFVSSTRPGVTRGHHYHDSKVEKFCVIQGQAVIRLRNVLLDETVEFPVSGEDIHVVDIPPGYTHSITNAGSADLITLFWANEMLNPNEPDVHHEPV